MTEITQADRDAAADHLRDQQPLSWGARNRIRIREGMDDDNPLVQAFARHREAAEQGMAELVEALEAARETIEELLAAITDTRGVKDCTPLLTRLDAALQKARTL